MSKRRLFTLSLLLTTAAFLVHYYLQRPTRYALRLVPVGDNVFITAQLAPENVSFLRWRWVRTLVDIRPDGEVPGQPSSAEVGAAARARGIDFRYIPVPHEGIPDAAVAALGDVLARSHARTVLYCHSGRRAVRTFALAEASRPDGPSADAILGMVRTAGFSADDLRADIAQRIAHRDASPSLPPSDEHAAPSP